MTEVMTPGMIRTLERQLTKWHKVEDARPAPKDPKLRVITVSRQPGSGGKIVAARAAMQLRLRFYDRDIIQKVAEIAKIKTSVVESRDEKPHSLFEGMMDSLVNQRGIVPTRYLKHLNLLPDEYVQILRQVVEDIADHEGGIVVGRGANYILPPERAFRVRIVAPQPLRVERIAAVLQITPAKAKRLVQRRDADRRAFVKHYYNEDIADPDHYDLVLNSGTFSIDQCAESLVLAWNIIHHGKAHHIPVEPVTEGLPDVVVPGAKKPARKTVSRTKAKPRSRAAKKR